MILRNPSLLEGKNFNLVLDPSRFHEKPKASAPQPLPYGYVEMRPV